MQILDPVQPQKDDLQISLHAADQVVVRQTRLGVLPRTPWAWMEESSMRRWTKFWNSSMQVGALCRTRLRIRFARTVIVPSRMYEGEDVAFKQREFSGIS